MYRLEKIIRKVDRSIQIVRGYHDFCQPPEIAVDEGLGCRVAFILDTYRRSKVDMFFDAELFCSIVLGIEKLLVPEKVEIFVVEGEVLDSISLFKENLFSQPEVNREPPGKIVFTKDGLISCCIHTEFWAHAGGPMPYYDSYTESVYTKTDISEQLIVLCDDICDELEGTITAIFDLSPVPKQNKGKK